MLKFKVKITIVTIAINFMFQKFIKTWKLYIYPNKHKNNDIDKQINLAF